MTKVYVFSPTSKGDLIRFAQNSNYHRELTETPDVCLGKGLILSWPEAFEAWSEERLTRIGNELREMSFFEISVNIKCKANK